MVPNAHIVSALVDLAQQHAGTRFSEAVGMRALSLVHALLADAMAEDDAELAARLAAAALSLRLDSSFPALPSASTRSSAHAATNENNGWFDALAGVSVGGGADGSGAVANTGVVPATTPCAAPAGAGAADEAAGPYAVALAVSKPTDFVAHLRDALRRYEPRLTTDHLAALVPLDAVPADVPWDAVPADVPLRKAALSIADVACEADGKGVEWFAQASCAAQDEHEGVVDACVSAGAGAGAATHDG
jgi:hypothetical protein